MPISREPEFDRIVAMCLSPLSDVQEGLESQSFDWQLLRRLSARHRVDGLVWQQLRASSYPIMPEGIAADFRLAHRRQSFAYLSLLAETLRLTMLFESHGYATITLKGCPLARQLYPSEPALRHAKDIDLLVDPVDFAGVEALLLREGYQRRTPASIMPTTAESMARYMSSAFEYVHIARRQTVELHHRLLTDPHAMAIPWNELLAGAQWVEVGAGRVRCLGRHDGLIYLCCHAAGHRFFRLKWLADIARWLALNPDTDPTALFARAQTLGCQRQVRLTLRVLEQLSGRTALPLDPNELRDVTGLAASAMQAIKKVDGPQPHFRLSDLPDDLRAMSYELRLAASWRSRLMTLLLHLCNHKDFTSLGFGVERRWLYGVAGRPLALMRLLKRWSHTVSERMAVATAGLRKGKELSPDWQLLKEIAFFRSRLIVLTLSLFLARALSEGAIFLLLVPILQLAGAVSAGNPAMGVFEGHARLRAVLPENLAFESALLSLFALMLLRAALGYAGQHVSISFQTSFVHSLRQRLYLSLSRANWSFLARKNKAHDAYALTMQCDRIGVATLLLLNLTSSLVTATCAFAVVLHLAYSLTVTVVLVCGLLVVPTMRFQKWAYVRGETAQSALRAVFSVLQGRMNGLKLTKAFAIERRMEAEFSASSLAYRKALIDQRENSARVSLVQECAAAVILVLIIYGGVNYLKVSGVELATFVVVFGRLTPMIFGIQTNLRSLAGLLPEYSAFRSQESSARAHVELMPVSPVPIPLRRSLRLESIGYAYPGNADRPVLRNVNLTIAAGSAIGIMGLSGAGKSTLVDIIAGLIAPDHGRLFVDDADITFHDRPHWRSCVAYLPQDAPLFHASLRDNLCLGAPGISDREIWDCLEVVQAAGMVRALPLGLETAAGDNGVLSSGGERQRIRLASALLRRPQLLILDESTSALNSIDEAQIIAALQALRDRMTILVVAHRWSSVAWTDRVLLLKDGNVVAGEDHETIRVADRRSCADIDQGREYVVHPRGK